MSLSAYVKTVWSDRAVQFVRRYIMNLVSGSTYDLTPSEGTISNAGTAMTAARMNNIENQVEAVTNEVIAHEVDYVRQPGYGVTAGTTTAYTLTLNPAPVSLTDGMGIAIKMHAANTGACTVNPNGLGAIPLKDPYGNDFPAGNLKINYIYSFKYDAVSGNFISQGKGGGISGAYISPKGWARNSAVASAVAAYSDSGDIITISGKGVIKRIIVWGTGTPYQCRAKVSIDGGSYNNVGFVADGGAGSHPGFSSYGINEWCEAYFQNSLNIRAHNGGSPVQDVTVIVHWSPV